MWRYASIFRSTSEYKMWVLNREPDFLSFFICQPVKFNHIWVGKHHRDPTEDTTLDTPNMKLASWHLFGLWPLQHIASTQPLYPYLFHVVIITTATLAYNTGMRWHLLRPQKLGCNFITSPIHAAIHSPCMLSFVGKIEASGYMSWCIDEEIQCWSKLLRTTLQNLMLMLTLQHLMLMLSAQH